MRKLSEWVRSLWAWLRERITGRPPDKGPPLRKIENAIVEIDMSGDVLLSWTNPTQRTDGVPAEPAEFEIRVGLKAAAAPEFTPLKVVPGQDAPQVSLVDQAGGDYVFELTLYDLTLDKAQPPIIEAFTVPAGDLNPLTNVTVDVT